MTRVLVTNRSSAEVLSPPSCLARTHAWAPASTHLPGARHETPICERSKRKVDTDGVCRPVAHDGAWRRTRCRDSRLCLEEGSGPEPSKVSKSKHWSKAPHSTG
jgi:hypothetical protein